MVEVEDRDTFAACLLMPWSSMKPFGKLKLQKFIDLDVFRSFSGLFNVLKVLVWRRWALAFLGSSRWGNFLGSFPNWQDQEEDPACGDPSCEWWSRHLLAKFDALDVFAKHLSIAPWVLRDFSWQAIYHPKGRCSVSRRPWPPRTDSGPDWFLCIYLELYAYIDIPGFFGQPDYLFLC